MNAPAIAGTRAPAPRDVPRVRGELVIEQCSDLSWSRADVAALDALIDLRPHVGVFMTHAWLSGYFAEPARRSEPVVLVMREGGAIRGVIPLAIRQTLTHARVSLLGGGMGSDRVDLLTARGYEGACSDRFMEWLEREFPRGYVLELRDVPDDSSLWGAIGRLTADKEPHVMFAPREVYALPYLPLHDDRPGRIASDPIDPESSTRHRRWLERKCHVRIDAMTTADDVCQAFDTLGDLLRARWGTEESVLESARVQRFHRHVLPLLLREGRLRMMRILGDMRPIAVFYGLASRLPETGAHRVASGDSWWGYYLAGYDRAWAGRIHLGRVALAAAIDLAAKEGASEFDFLKGSERVKYLWPVRERISVDADVYSRNLGPRLTWAARAARTAAAALIRSTHELR